MIFIVLSSLETVHDTVQYRCCTFSFPSPLLRVRLKRQNPLLSYVREREREREKYTANVHCSVQVTADLQCSVQYTIISLFNVSNVLLCVIHELNFTVFMHVT